MPRGSRHRSHKQHHNNVSKDSSDLPDADTGRYGSESRFPLVMEAKEMTVDDRVDSRHEIQKRKYSPRSRELSQGNPGRHVSSKKKKMESSDALQVGSHGSSPLPLSDRWNCGQGQGDVLPLLTYIHYGKDKDSKRGSDRTDRNFGALGEGVESRTDKSVRGKGSDIRQDIHEGCGTASAASAYAAVHLASAKVDKYKMSRRRESEELVTERGSSSKFADESPLLEKALSDALRPRKSMSVKSLTKGRGVKVFSKNDMKDHGDGSVSCNLDVRKMIEKDCFLEDSSPKQHKSTDFRIEGNLHNFELDKKTENRRQKQKEEFEEKARWRDDDRDAESKLICRHSSQKDTGNKNWRPRDEGNKTDKCNRHKDFRYKEGKYFEERYKDDKHTNGRHRERQMNREQFTEKYENRHSREGSKIRGWYSEIKHHNSDWDCSFSRVDSHSQNRDQHEDKNHNHVHEVSRESNVSGCNKALPAEDCNKDFSNRLKQKCCHEKIPFRAYDDANERQGKLFFEDTNNKDQRCVFKYTELESMGKLCKENSRRSKADQSRILEHFPSIQRESMHGKNNTQKETDACGIESPHLSTRSSTYEGRSSPLLYQFENSAGSNGKTKLSLDLPGQAKGQSSTNVLVPRTHQVTTVYDETSPSAAETAPSSNNNAILDESSTTPLTGPSGSKGDAPHQSRRNLHNRTLVSTETNAKGHHGDEMSAKRSDWSGHGNQMRSKISSMATRPGVLPPPPPLRPGVDNPAVVGATTNGFEDGASLRDRRDSRQSGRHYKRGDIKGGSNQGDCWKSLGNWNTQGQGSGNLFVPFQHHMLAGQRQGGFVNLGQQYSGPPFFGTRPSTDMSNVHFHMRDVGDSFSSQSRHFGWQRQSDEISTPHTPVPFHGWNESASCLEESHAYGRPVRDINSRHWDRGNDMWKVNIRDTEESWYVPRARGDKNRMERSLTESIEIKRSEDDPPKIMLENQRVSLKTDSKQLSKHMHEKISVYLSKVDISECLAGEELYNDCARILDWEKDFNHSGNNCKGNVNSEANVDNRDLEGDKEAEKVLSKSHVHVNIFPRLSTAIFEGAVALYKKGIEGRRLEDAAVSQDAIPDTHNCVITSSETDKEFTSECNLNIASNMNLAVRKKNEVSLISSLSNCCVDRIKSTFQDGYANPSINQVSDVDSTVETGMIGAVPEDVLKKPLINNDNHETYLEEQHADTVSSEKQNCDSETCKTLQRDASGNILMQKEEVVMRGRPEQISMESRGHVQSIDAECATTMLSNFEREQNKEEDSIMVLNSHTGCHISEFVEAHATVDNVNMPCLDSVSQNDLYANIGIQQDHLPEKVDDTVGPKVGTRNFSPFNLHGDTH